MCYQIFQRGKKLAHICNTVALPFLLVVHYPDLLPKEAANKHQGSRRTKLTALG
jgi:hypothetical protein